VRAATIADADLLVHHRVGMFSDMGLTFDVPRLEAAFRAWLDTMMPSGAYRAWLVEDAAKEVVAGGGITILPWPPGPGYGGDRMH
jgi:hypothetical protein